MITDCCEAEEILKEISKLGHAFGQRGLKEFLGHLYTLTRV